MKKLLRLLMVIMVAAAALGGLVFAYLEMRKERDMEAASEAPVVAPSVVERDQEGGPFLKLDATIEQRLGLKTAMPTTGMVARAVIGNARVLDGAGIRGQWNEIQAAQTALEAARRDYERKLKLFAHGQNASAAAVEAAEALVKQCQVALVSAQDRLAATWGVTLAKREDLPALAQALLAREAALVQVELLATTKLAVEPQTVHLFRQNGAAVAIAQVLGTALAADSPVIGQAYLALVATNATALTPGAFLVARVETGERDVGAVLPRDAVLRHGGQGWVYVQTGSHTYTRRPVPLDRPHPDGWLVPGHWTQPVIVSGAQSLLSEELKGSIQMRD